MGAPSPRKKKPDTKAILAAARLPERSVDLCLRGDLVARWQELAREFVDAEREDKVHADLDGGKARPLAEQIAALQDEMREHSLVLKLHALPRRKWTALMAAHPPREDDKTDELLGLNRETFYDALVRACVAEPALDEDDWAHLDEVLSDGQWQALNNAAWAVNARDVDIPFSRGASQILASYAPE